MPFKSWLKERSERSTEQDSFKRTTETPQSVQEALDKFQAVGWRGLRWMLTVIPLVVIIVLLVVPVLLYDLLQYSVIPDDPMYVSGILTLALALLAFHPLFLTNRIRDTLGDLWKRNAIRGVSSAIAPRREPTSRLVDEQSYAKFIYDLRGFMNNDYFQLTSGALFALIAFFIFWAALNGSSIVSFIARYGIEQWDDLIPIGEAAAIVLAGFVIGLMAWRMVAIAYQLGTLIRGVATSKEGQSRLHRFWIRIKGIGPKVELAPRLSDPDGCGGFRDLGNLFILNVLVVTIPVVFLVAWIVLIVAKQEIALQYDHDGFVQLFTGLLCVPIAWGLVTFVLPVLKLHTLMLAERATLQPRLIAWSNRVDQLADQLTKGTAGMNVRRAGEILKELESNQNLLEEFGHPPEWPIDYPILIQFLTAQGITLVGVIVPFLQNLLAAR